uniref:DH domain-containing protein n=1 Tax=Globisporangium ultimum (strain ATCC 200006 / CBS 805.95 / DAOM BR144) TaxID=431595 RepID=K3XBM8_GLOUD
MGSNCCEHKSGVASPRRTYLPRLATLDLTGDSRYFLHHPSSLESPNAIITDDDARNEQVERICDEIYMTECAYVSDLKTLLHHFFEPLQDYAIKHTIDLGAMTALHSSIKIILHIHKELLRQLLTLSDSNNEVSSYSDEEIVSVDEQLLSPPVSISSLPRYVAAFDFTIEFMKVYAFYCSSYLSAKDELALLQKKYPGLGTLTTQLNEHARDELHVDILAHMIKPVQRICQYPIFFRELLKNVVTEQDAANVEHTLHKIESVAMHVNEKVREAQQNARLFELHQTIDSKSAKVDLLQPSRTLLSEAVVRVVILDLPRWPSFFSKLRFRRRRSDEAAPPLLRRRSSGDKVRLILLSDALLMAKKHEEKLKVQRQLCLSCASVQDCKDDPNAPKCSFMMEVSKVGRCQCHQLTPATLKRSPKWRNSLSMITGSTTSTMTPQPRSKAPRKATS